MYLSKYITGTFIAGLMIAILFSSCRKLLIGNGDMIQQTATLTAFTDVINNGDFDITVIPSSRFFIKLEGESNMLAQTETVIRTGNELSIQYKNSADAGRHRTVKVWLEAPVFKSLNISGSGNIETKSTDFLRAEVYASGNVFYKGNPQIETVVVGSGGVHQRQ